MKWVVNLPRWRNFEHCTTTISIKPIFKCVIFFEAFLNIFWKVSVFIFRTLIHWTIRGWLTPNVRGQPEDGNELTENKKYTKVVDLRSDVWTLSLCYLVQLKDFRADDSTD